MFVVFSFLPLYFYIFCSSATKLVVNMRFQLELWIIQLLFNTICFKHTPYLHQKWASAHGLFYSSLSTSQDHVGFWGAFGAAASSVMCEGLTLLCWGVPYSLRSAFSPYTHPFQTAHTLWAVHQFAVGSSSVGRGRTRGREAPPSPSCSTSLAEKNADSIPSVYPVLFTGSGLYIQRCVQYFSDNWLIKLIWTQECLAPVVIDH